MPNGMICYLEIPASDVEASARFYATVFGWSLRTRGDGARAFDTVGGVSGSWVTDRPAADDPGTLAYIMVESIEATLAAIEANGGKRVTPFVPHGDPRMGHATFRDPAGNLLGLYQEPSQ